MTRHEILKTYKLFIGGQFPRTESGRYLKVEGRGGELVANICRASRKDLRNAVSSARKAQPGWAGRTAYNRSQILYRVAEVLEGRRPQFISELVTLGWKPGDAEAEVSFAADLWVYFAGWCDKYQQVYGTVNPVASSHFNFSVPEPMGVIGIMAAESSPLVSLSALAASAIAGGNSVVALTGPGASLPAITLAEVIHSSDVPGGVVNILTGLYDELAPQFASHMDVNAVVSAEPSVDARPLYEAGAANIKRISDLTHMNWKKYEPSPEILVSLQEIKTTWHPVETPVSGSGAY